MARLVSDEEFDSLLSGGGGSRSRSAIVPDPNAGLDPEDTDDEASLAEAKSIGDYAPGTTRINRAQMTDRQKLALLRDQLSSAGDDHTGEGGKMELEREIARLENKLGTSAPAGRPTRAISDTPGTESIQASTVGYALPNDDPVSRKLLGLPARERKKETEAPRDMKKEEEPGLIHRAARDTALDVAKGVVGLGESVVGIADLGTGGYAGKALAYIGYDPQASAKMISDLYTPQRKRANANVEAAQGFFDTAGALVTNPSALIGTIAESAPGMVGIVGAGRALATNIFMKGAKSVAGGITKDAAGKIVLSQEAIAAGQKAVGEATTKIIATGAVAEGAQGAGSIAEQARQADREWKDYVLPSIAAGAGTAGISMATGKLGKSAIGRKLGLGDPESTLATAGLTDTSERTARSAVRQALKEGVGGAVTEGVLEEMPQSAQEQAMTNVAMGKPIGQGVPEAAAQGMMAGAGMGGPIGAFHGATRAAPAAATTQAGGAAATGEAGAPAAAQPAGTPPPPPPGAAPVTGQVDPATGEPIPPKKVVTEEVLLDMAAKQIDELSARARKEPVVGADEQGPKVEEPDALSPRESKILTDLRVLTRTKNLDALATFFDVELQGAAATAAPAAAAATAAPAAAGATAAPAAPAAAAAAPERDAEFSDLKDFATPKAREDLKAAGLTVADVTGSGPFGRITEQDVQRSKTGRDRAQLGGRGADAQGEPRAEGAGQNAAANDPDAKAALRDLGHAATATEDMPDADAPASIEVRGQKYDATRIGKRTYAKLQRFAKLFGKELVLFDNQPGADRWDDGFVHPKSSKHIFLSSVAQGAPHMVLFGHELMHAMERDLPAVWAKLKKAIIKVAKPDAVERLKEDYKSLLEQGKTEKPYSQAEIEDIVWQEIVSDMGGNRLQEVETWKKIFKGLENHGMVVRVARYVHDMIGNAINFARRQKKGFVTDDYIKDLDAVRDAVAKAAIEYIRFAQKPPAKAEAEKKVVNAQAQAQPPPEAAAPPAGPQAKGPVPVAAPAPAVGKIEEAKPAEKAKPAPVAPETPPAKAKREQEEKKAQPELKPKGRTVDQWLKEYGAKDVWNSPDELKDVLSGLEEDIEINAEPAWKQGLTQAADAIAAHLIEMRAPLTAQELEDIEPPEEAIVHEDEALAEAVVVPPASEKQPISERSLFDLFDAAGKGDDKAAKAEIAKRVDPKPGDDDNTKYEKAKARREWLDYQIGATGSEKKAAKLQEERNKLAEDIHFMEYRQPSENKSKKYETAAPQKVSKGRLVVEGVGNLTITEKEFGKIVDTFEEVMGDPANAISMDTKLGKNFVSVVEANKRIASWKANAKKQGRGGGNSNRTVLSFFDLTGEWAKPWFEAGYNVITFDLQSGQNVLDFSAEYFTENWDIGDVYAILAAVPCTRFSAAGNRHRAAHKAGGDSKDMKLAKALAWQTMRTIEYFRPTLWAIENPVGTIEKETGLPSWRLAFNPHHFGPTPNQEDLPKQYQEHGGGYTKKTLLWGNFNPDLPTANVPGYWNWDKNEGDVGPDGTKGMGSIMQRLYGGSSEKTKNARSITPEGFAYAFFQANNYNDLTPQQRLVADFPQIANAVIGAAQAGISEKEIREIAEGDQDSGYLYGNEDYEGAADALLKAAKRAKMTPAARAALEKSEAAAKKTKKGKVKRSGLRLAEIGDQAKSIMRSGLREAKPKAQGSSFHPVEGTRAHDIEVSTRVPTSLSKVNEDATKQLLLVGIPSIEDKAFAKNVELVMEYPNYRSDKRIVTHDAQADRFIEHIVGNLIWLHNLVPAATRERSKKWYVGGRKLVDELAARYARTDAQIAGVIAALSPQKDWFMNVSLARRVADIAGTKLDYRWDKAMTQTANRIFAKPQYRQIVELMKGRRFGDVQDLDVAAAWLRTYDEAHNPRSYHVFSPEGEDLGLNRNMDGAASRVAWGSLGEIAKALTMFESGDYTVISDRLGTYHKVRSFFNNLLVPYSENGHSTIDTHAVAAALLRPLSGGSIEVKHNFGILSATSVFTGMQGTYGLYVEAYRRAARELGMLPRELQSITWEAIRGLYSATFKAAETRLPTVNRLWENYGEGKLTLENVREKIIAQVGGITPPAWERPSAGRDEARPAAADARELPRALVPGGRAETASGRAGGEPAGAVQGVKRSGIRRAPEYFSAKQGPRLTGEVLSLRNPRRTHGQYYADQGLTTHRHDVLRRSDGKKIGEAVLSWDDAGKVGVIMSVEWQENLRKQGLGEEFIADVVNNNGPAAPDILVHNILDSALGFWSNMGVEEFFKFEGNNYGYLSQEKFNTARGVEGAAQDEAAAGLGEERGRDREDARGVQGRAESLGPDAGRAVARQARDRARPAGWLASSPLGEDALDFTRIQRSGIRRANPQGQQADQLNEELDAVTQQIRDSAPGGSRLEAYINAAGELFVANLEVPENQRGQGTGIAMMRQLLDWADQNNLQVALDPRADKGKKAALARFYKELGFKKSSSARDYDPASGGELRRPAASERVKRSGIREQPIKWYSELARKIQAGPNSAPAAAWKGYINGLAQKGVKPEEIQWSGVLDYLDVPEIMGTGNIPKEKILAYLNANGVYVEDRVQGGNGGAEFDASFGEWLEDEPDEEHFRTEARDLYMEQARDDLAAQRGEALSEISDDDAMELALEQARKNYYDDPERPHHLAIEADVNGKSYKFIATQEHGEFDLFAPANQGNELDAAGGESLMPKSSRRNRVPDNAQMERMIRDYLGEKLNINFDEESTPFETYTLPGGSNYTIHKLVVPVVEDSYRSPHFTERNIVAHIRTKDRFDAKGGKVLFLEEIQSDWAQEGRDKGFKTPERDSQIDAARKELADMESAVEAARSLRERRQGDLDHWRAELDKRATQETADKIAKAVEIRDEATFAYDKLLDQRRELDKKIGKLKGAKIPLAPFVRKTDAWVSLAVKRMMMKAVDEGYDKVAWTTGEQQAERYRLDKYVDQIIAKPSATLPKAGEARKIHMHVVGKNGATIVQNNYDPAELPGVIGKEMASRIVKDIADDPGTHVFNNVDLKIGGEGMRTFYDQIVPKVANEQLKKLGAGTNVGRVEIPQITDDGHSRFFVVRVNGEIADRTNTYEAAQQSVALLKKTGTKGEVTIEPLAQPGFEITPELKESLRKGVPLFSGIRESTAKRAEALKSVEQAPKVKWGFEIDFASERRRHADTGTPSSVVEKDPVTFKTMGGKRKIEAREFSAYDEKGKLVGTLSVVTKGEGLGAAKITVRDDAQRQGYGRKMLDAAEAAGVELNPEANRFSPEGRDLVRDWLTREMTTTNGGLDNVAVDDIGFVIANDHLLDGDDAARQYLYTHPEKVTIQQIDPFDVAVTIPDRAHDREKVRDYRALGTEPPPIIVEKNTKGGETYRLREGFHRLTAAKKNKAMVVPAIDVTELLKKDWPAILGVKRSGIREKARLSGYDEPSAREKGPPSPYSTPELRGLPVDLVSKTYYMLKEGKSEQEVMDILEAVNVRDPAAALDRLKRSGVRSLRTKAAVSMSNATIIPSYFRAAWDLAADLMRPTEKGEFNWWHRTFGTQFHKAMQNEHFKKVFDLAQKFLDHIAMFAIRAEKMAPSIFPSLGQLALKWEIGRTLPRLKGLGLSKADNMLIGRALAEGTLAGGEQGPHYGKVWSDAELISRYNMTPEQRGYYREARASVNQSLGDTAKALMAQAARTAKVPQSLIDSLMEQYQVPDKLSDVRDALLNAMQPGKRALDAEKQIKKIYGQTVSLMAGGYWPLMRFGKYTVEVRKTDPLDPKKTTTVFFSMHETKAERERISKAVREDPRFRGMDHIAGEMNEEQHRLFNGISMDTMEAFVNAMPYTNAEEEAARQHYLGLALSSRSALSRMVERKGTEGYTFDATRTLASFITSNARYGSRAVNGAPLLAAAANIPKGQGNVATEATLLRDYVMNPKEGAAKFRGFLFAQYLGGSIAAGLVNLTQPVLMTYPYLAQFGMRRASRVMVSGMADTMAWFFGKVGDPAMAAALKRAAAQGIIEPQEIFQLMAAARTGTSSFLSAKFMRLWGAFFSATEMFNRTITFAAAYRIGKELPKTDPYEFAVKAVADSQGLYNKANRPNLARETGAAGTVGTIAFTFKQYSIGYVEFLKRLYGDGLLPKPAFLLALGLLWLAAGAEGEPGSEDIDDVLETVWGWMGRPLNMKKEKRKFLRETLGLNKGTSDFLLQGVSSVLPLDVQGRLGMHNLVPGTAMLNPARQDEVGGEALEVLGVTGGLFKTIGEGFAHLKKGELGGAAATVAPKAIRDIVQAYDMWTTGKMKDKADRVTMPATKTAAVVKAVGFNPAENAAEQEVLGMLHTDKKIVTSKKQEWHQRLAKAIAEGDEKAKQAVVKELTDWRARFPDYPITINWPAVQKRAQEMRRTRAERFIKTAPREMRGQAREALLNQEE